MVVITIKNNMVVFISGIKRHESYISRALPPFHETKTNAGRPLTASNGSKAYQIIISHIKRPFDNCPKLLRHRLNISICSGSAAHQVKRLFYYFHFNAIPTVSGYLLPFFVILKLNY